jgi:peptide/nickel transport system ATP-binding protein
MDMNSAKQPVLSVRNLTIDFPNRRGNFRAVEDVSFDLMRGEILGVIGESGAGKSMTGAAIIGLIASPGRITAGEILLDGERIDNLPAEAMLKIRGKRIGTIFQDPLTSLNPLFTIGDQLIETIRRHLSLTKSQARARAIALLEEVGIPRAAERLAAYPHQFSGGMRQRVVIALALAAEPEVVIADEATSALDVSVQAQILELLRVTCQRRGTAIMMITHDMGAVAQTAQRMIVMNKGRIVEAGAVGAVLGNPHEVYTRSLIKAIPSIADDSRRKAPAQGAEIMVSVDRLSRQFDISTSVFDKLLKRSDRAAVKAVDDVSFQIPRGSTFGLVGESGSGKSTCARIIAGLTRPTSGRISIMGQDIWKSGAGVKRGSVQMIFQDPYASLNPSWRVDRIIGEPMRSGGGDNNRSAVEDRVAGLLRQVRLNTDAMRKYPHEFSGGQRQRIAIARALATQPEFIICDEPTSALDVSVQAQVLDLMSELQETYGLTYLLISHNLAVVKRMSNFVGVMRNGQMAEQGPVDAIFGDPKSDYTRMLLDAVPDISSFR